ncbi:putative signal transducing protein [Psychrobacter lutiphocae]|uniref:putative signal transducing protein n=1 Tax=Psychrobacter lutiphocae TaxID=540500 RepID=UPI0003671CEE|nr:DUF2007 domain-containing protein [Psychrobacter lutiphocae]
MSKPIDKQLDNWQKLASYSTNLQAEMFANLLRNNGINVSLQTLSAIPGMNSGSILWVQQDDLQKAQSILDSIDSHTLDDSNNEG